ncbi:MAG: uroporphyrinogen decarboxylase family protein [Armatimonadota bacterium]|nr:methyltransferase [bacterium]
MSATSRELVYQTLNFENPIRAPRQLWPLPWASDHYPNELDKINKDFPPDFGGVNGHFHELAATQGDHFRKGRYVDAWGCVFENIADGIVGEVKDPLIKDWNTDISKVHVPREWLTADIDLINKDCDSMDTFIMADVCPRPFEQLQFLRGSENLYMDLADPPQAMLDFMKKMHSFYCEVLEMWAKTNVDALMFMDDWGSQQTLLIRPASWREIFKPMYRDYIQIAHNAGKKAFMHSDGNILSIYPDLIELGLDALNSQLFCMGVENLKSFAGKITFWGEIDRQHILPNGTTADVDAAVKLVYNNLWKSGGCVAQCEFGPGARPENVRQVFQSWDEISRA